MQSASKWQELFLPRVSTSSTHSDGTVAYSDDDFFSSDDDKQHDDWGSLVDDYVDDSLTGADDDYSADDTTPGL